MQWSNVRLIYVREMRDQLRDRRTLFLIAVLPLLLYPLLGASFFQLSQFMRESAARVLVVGSEELDGIAWLPRLLDTERFDASLFDSERQQNNLQLVWPKSLLANNSKSDDSSVAVSEPIDWSDEEGREAAARRLVDGGEVDVVLLFPKGFGQGLREARDAVVDRKAQGNVPLPEPIMFYNSANEKSQLAQLRVEQTLQQWRQEVTQKNLLDSNVPVEATRPFTLRPRDVAALGQRQAAVWSKILPFVVFIWALTGAFYPAVDLCAGEKERGTLETLLTSPALRREIVWGKLLTVMTFSSATALLNLSSLGVTGKFVMDQLNEFTSLSSAAPLSLPSVASLGWLAVALLPISALFSALCLACAAFARSTKEGQYYLMPLMLVTMPLMLLPMAPGVDLNLGNSLIPVTGLVLLLRALIEGQYLAAAPFVAPTVGVTLMCCLLAIRWAEEQFNSESVLFRESERLQLGRWVTHLVRDRGATPSIAQAALCMAIILIVQFFVSVAQVSDSTGALSFSFLAKSLLISQLACILLPTAVMALVLTRDPRKTLLLDRLPKASHLAAAALLALMLHPLVVRFGEVIQWVYPMSADIEASAGAIQKALADAPHWWVTFALMALLPAFCEELAFRGFLLSGLRHLGHKWWAIGLSAIAFGGVHMFLQQRISAAAVGVVLGYLAVQTGSLLPCMLFHGLHNGLQITLLHLTQQSEQGAVASDGLAAKLQLLVSGKEPLLYSPLALALCGVATLAILWSLRNVSYSRTREELRQEARDRQASQFAGA